MMTDERTGLATEEVERRLIAFVQDELLGSETAVGRDDDLLSGGLLDSIGVLRLAAFVQEAFDFVMPPGDFVVEHFRTVAALTDYVRRGVAGPSSADAER